MIEDWMAQYSLAGLVVYVFYKLYSNEFKNLKESIDEGFKEIRDVLEEIRDELRRR